MPSKDHYKILGISKNATPEEIRKAYHKLAHKFHPDKGGDEERFKEINEAYQVLSSKQKKAQYDQFGKTFDQNSGPSQGFDFGSTFGQNGSFNFDFEDLESVFGNAFGFGTGRSNAKEEDLRTGEDIRIDLELNLEDILENQQKEIKIRKYVVCDKCNGKGSKPGTKMKKCSTCGGVGKVKTIKRTIFGSFARINVCPECHGEGYVPEKTCSACRGEGRIKKEEKIKFSIPKGIDANQVLRIPGLGNAGKRNGSAGDLYVRIFLKPHHLFKREGNNLYSNTSISFPQAVLGDEIEIPTLEGKKLILKIPSGTESGKIFKIFGKGISYFSGIGRGDLYIKIKISIPRKISKEQKELLKQLKEKGM